MKYKNLIYFLNGSIGDFLMTLFLMENIHKNDNSIRFYVVTPSNRQVFYELSERYPYVAIIEANRRTFRGITASLGLLRFIFTANLVVTPPTPGVFPLHTKVTARMTALHPKSFFIGFNDGRRGGFLYTKLLHYDQTILYIDTIKNIVTELGFKITRKELRFSFVEHPHIFKEYGLIKGGYLILHPRGSDEKRSMKPADLIWLVERISEQYPDMTIVFSGSDADRPHIESALQIHLSDKILNLSGKVSMAELATLIAHATLYVGVDTGISHLAALLEVPSIVFSHVATVSNWLPYYNNNTDVLFKVWHTEERIYNDKTYLMEHCWGKICLEMPPKEVILNAIKKHLDRKK